MVKKSTKLAGDQFFIRENVKSPWEESKLSDLKAILSDRNTPYTKEEKLDMPQFGYGKVAEDMDNPQLYPTKIIVAELDTPKKYKTKLKNKEVFEHWHSFFTRLYEQLKADKSIPYRYMYLTPSMCGLRFIVKLDLEINNEEEYRQAVLDYLALFEKYDIDKSYHDIKIKTGWFLPPFKKYFDRGTKVFENKKQNAKINLEHKINRAVAQTDEANTFEEGNRNNYIYQLSINANRTGIEQEDLLEFISSGDLNYDPKEVEQTVKSGYKKKEEFGVWRERADTQPAVVNMNAMIKRSKEYEPIPVIWSGIKKGTMGFIFGPPKSGKTTLAECLALALAGGLTEFMGSPLIGDEMKVLYISLEEYWETRVERYKKQRAYLWAQYKKKGASRFFTNNENFISYIMDEADLKFIETEINRCEPQVIIIDSFTRMLVEKVEDSTRVNKMMVKLRAISQKTDTTLIMIHHTTKAKDKNLSFLNMAGSRVLSQEADFLIGVNRSDSGERYVKDVLFRYARESEEVVPFEINESRWTVPGEPMSESMVVEKKDGRLDDTNKQAILEYIKEAEKAVTVMEIKEHFNNALSKKTIYNNLNKLLKEGKVIRLGKGLYIYSVDSSISLN